MDEETSVSRSLRNKDIETAAVILDFKKQQVLQAHLNGRSIERDWQRVHDYYHQHYAEVFRQLHAHQGRAPVNDTTAT